MERREARKIMKTSKPRWGFMAKLLAFVLIFNILIPGVVFGNENIQIDEVDFNTDWLGIELTTSTGSSTSGSSAGGEIKTYKFEAKVDLAGVAQDAAISGGQVYGDGYFELVGNAKRANSSTISLELSRAAASYLTFTTSGISTVTIVASSTGGSNTSAIALWDSNDATQIEKSNITTVYGTALTTLTFEDLPAGTYKIVSPNDTNYQRGMRVYEITVEVDEPSGSSGEIQTYKFEAKVDLADVAQDAAISGGKLYGNGYFELVGNAKRANSSTISLELSRAAASYLMFTTRGISTVTILASSTGGSNTSAIALWDANDTAQIEKSNITTVYGTALTTLTFENLPAGTYKVVSPNDANYQRGMRVYEVIAEVEEAGAPGIKINNEPVNITIGQDRINATTRLGVNAEALNTISPTLSYQWYKAADADGSGSQVVSGATEANYTIPVGTEAGTYYYYCVITADNGTVSATTRVATVKITPSGTFAEWGINPPVEWAFGFQRVSFMPENPQMYLNDALALIDPANSDAVPILQNGVLLLPFSAAKVALGTSTSWLWNETANAVEATYGAKTAKLFIGSKTMQVGAASITLAAAPEFVGNTLYLPVADIANALGNASVGFDSETGVMIVTIGANVSQDKVAHGAMNNQPEQWYGSNESIRLADNLLLFQRNSGGWYKNVDFGVTMTDQIRTELLSQKNLTDDTIDNGATIPEIRYLIKVYQATKIERYRDAYILGLNGVLNAQYSNGGFPQYIDQRSSYHGEITFNDDATVHILRCWFDILNNPNSFYSIDEVLKQRVENSLIKAIDVILDTQIYSEAQGMLTAWCAQHDRVTLEPSWARAYEPPSISGYESVKIISFLTSLDQNFLKSLDDENILGEDKTVWERVQNAIHSAAAFYARSEIFGLQHTSGTSPWGGDRILVANPEARGLWARFIDIDTFEPLFVDRDSPTFRTNPDERLTYGEINTGFMIGKHSPAAGGNLRNVYDENGEIDIIASYAGLSHERRNGYQFIGDYGLAVPAIYNAWLVKNNLPIPVSEISGIYNSVVVGNVTLNSVVVPTNASKQNIVWTVVDAGGTGATIVGNTLRTTKTGTITIRATIAGGNFDGTAFTQEFTIEVKDSIPVTNITGIPTVLPIGTYNFNKLSVVPANAPNKNIVWNIVDDGGIGALINGNTFTAAAAGDVTISATIINGISSGNNYTQTFTIKIHDDPVNEINQHLPDSALISDWKVLNTTLSNNGNWATSYNKGNFGIGSPLYADRAHAGTFNVSELPDFLVGLDWIQTSMDARNGASSSQMVFTVKEDVIVYLAVELRTDMSRVYWVDDTWKFMGVDLFLRNSEIQGGFDQFAGVANSGTGKHYLYSKVFKAGEVVRLGAINQGTGLGNMMFILDPNVVYTVTYNANGAGSGSVPTDTQKYNAGSSATILGNTGNLYRSGYTFGGWTLNPNGTGTVYNAGNKITIGTNNITLYAKWDIIDNSNSGDNDDDEDTDNGGGSGGGTTPAPTPTPAPSSTPTPTQKPAEETKKAVEQAVNKGEEIIIKLEANELLNISMETIQTIIKNDKPLFIEKQGIIVEISPANLEGLAAGSAIAADKTINIAIDPVKNLPELEQIKKNMNAAERTEAVFDSTIVNITITVGNGEVTSYSQPIKVSVDLSAYNLAPGQIAKLSGARFNGNGTIDLLGGTYDSKTKTFTYFTSQLSTYGVVQAVNLMKIQMWIDNKQYFANNKILAFDTAPLLISSKTMVPLRAIAEAFGAEVGWESGTRTAIITLDGKTIKLTIDVLAPGMELAPVIINDRAMVPLRYISEAFGSNVLWNEETREITIFR